MRFCHANIKQVIMRCCSYNYRLIVLEMFDKILPNRTWPGGRIITYNTNTLQ